MLLVNLDPIGKDLGPHQYPFFRNKQTLLSFISTPEAPGAKFGGWSWRSLSIKVELFKWSLDGVLNQKTCQRQPCHSKTVFFLSIFFGNDTIMMIIIDQKIKLDDLLHFYESCFLDISYFSEDRNYKTSSERRSTSSLWEIWHLTCYVCLYVTSATKCTHRKKRIKIGLWSNPLISHQY